MTTRTKSFVRALGRPQLSADELSQLKWVLGGALILLSVWTVFYLEIDAWILMGLTMVAVGAGLVWPRWPARVPRWVHTLAFPAIVAFFLGDLWLKGEMLPAMVRLDIMLLLYRGISYRQRRDDLQVIVLGLFLIVVAGVLTVSLTFAVQILAFTGCALAFLLVITLTEDHEAKPVEAKKGLRGLITWNAPELGLPAWAEHMDWGRLVAKLRAVSDWRVLVLGGTLFVGVVAVSALLFLAIPRFQMDNSLFLERFIAKKARSGFNDSIKFGDVTEILQDNSVAMSVDVSDPTAVPASPYWRMLVLDEYREGGFRLSPGMNRAVFSPERKETLLRGEARAELGQPVFWTFYLESGVSRYLPLLGRFGELRFREVQNFRSSGELGLVTLRTEPATMTAYRVEGMRFADAMPDPVFAERWGRRGEVPESGRGEGLLQRRTGLGAEDRAVLARVRAEIGGGASAAEFAGAAGAWLTRNHSYSLAPKIPSGAGDALVRWTASQAEGHCELFAGALVLLARDAGFAARVVIGFRGGSWNGFSNNFTVRNSDAHAWAEIWDETRGAWLRADALAPASAAMAAAEGGTGAMAGRMDRSWTARLDSLRVFWYRRIVSFDASSQVETLKAVKTATENTGKRAREALERGVAALKAWLAGPWDLQRITTALMLAGGVAAAGWAGWNLRFWLRDLRWRGGSKKEDPVRREAGRLLANWSGDEADDAELRTELERLRYGPRATWLQPEIIFRRARSRLKARRR
jgi:transglutaminase-like putative cysteine protease